MGIRGIYYEKNNSKKNRILKKNIWGGILHYMHSTTTGRMQVVCGSCIRWLVSRTSSCADKLGGDWGRDEVQRTTKRYDDDGHVKDVWLRLLLLAAVMVAARALPPQTNRQTPNLSLIHI